jgi:hypothetical protein
VGSGIVRCQTRTLTLHDYGIYFDAPVYALVDSIKRGHCQPRLYEYRGEIRIIEGDKHTVKKNILFVFLFGALVLAQNAPVSLTVATSTAQATNTSNKEIVLLEIMVSARTKYPVVHEYYFKPGGFASGDVEEVVHSTPYGSTITSATPVFAQFADGSTWGTSDDAVQETIGRRALVRTLYNEALSAYHAQGEQAFLDRLARETGAAITFAQQFLLVQKQSGTAVAVDQMQTRLSTAESRSF